jgi:hemolysin III
MTNLNLSGPVAEEIANSVTHGIGLALSVAGLPVLVVLASLYGSASHIVSCSIYGGTLVLMYTASTLYHSFQAPRVKRVFKVLDHCAIYLLIAGTYTPFTLVTLWPSYGKALFGLVWGLALLGILMKVFFVGRFHTVSVLIYLFMGWMAVVAVKPILASIPLKGILWIVAGGLAYTFGVVFYAWKRLPYSHAIWHLFVLAGSVCHYFAVMFYVLPWQG